MNRSIRKFQCVFGFIAVIFAGLLLSCATSSPSSSAGNVSAQADYESRRAIYMEVIRAEGYLPSIASDDSIEFKRQSLTYNLVVSKNDPSFVYLHLRTILYVNSDAERYSAAIAVGNANRSTKVAKAYIAGLDREWVSIGAEVYLENPADFEKLFVRMMNAVNTSRDKIIAELN